MKKQILLTGCAGFIGSNFIKKITLKDEVKQQYNFVVADALTYAGNYLTIKKEIESYDHLHFEKGDIRDPQWIERLFKKYDFEGVLHFAAESHVDRSISNPNIFVETNVLGTLNLLNASLRKHEQCEKFRFLHISTDEVYGHLKETDPAFEETTPMAPNSPYSASKASSDMLVRSFFQTYQLPTLITRCSNNYGPYQYPEKLIPVIISRANKELKIPVYGKGENIRDWIHVHDHNEGAWKVFEDGKPGEVYNLGGSCELKNIELVQTLLKKMGKSENLIEFVTDRLGHDFRYAMNISKIKSELGWEPKIPFEKGIEETLNWYQNSLNWVESVQTKQY